MKAFMFQEPNHAELIEMDKPKPSEDEVRIKVAACGFCGTDIHTYKGEHVTEYPVVPGHEFSGVVDQIGSKVKNFKQGDKVVGDPNIFCENCDYCKENKQIHCKNIQVVGNTRNGAFAEYVTLPERCVFHIPPDSDMAAMAMAEPLACVINAHNKVTIPVGGKVLIFGAGTIGLLHLMIADHRGAAEVTIVDLREGQLETARKLGAAHTVLADVKEKEKLRQIAPDGFDVIIEATGVPAVAQKGIPMLRSTGTFVAFGAYPVNSRIEVDPQQIYIRDLKIVGSYALQKTMQQSIAMISGQKVELEALIGRKISIDEMPEVFQEFVQGKTLNKTMVIF